VIKGLHAMAASIDPELSDLIFKYRKTTEYHNCHLKEISLYQLLHESGLNLTPEYYGKKCDEDREIHLLFIERLDEYELRLFNSENHPELWDSETVKSTIETITKAHKYFEQNDCSVESNCVQLFNPEVNRNLYEKLISIILLEEENFDQKKILAVLYRFLDDLSDRPTVDSLPHTIIHNDFNPRNVAVRNNGSVCIYDWELAVLNIPHRDIVEFLAFVLPDNFSESDIVRYLEFHATLWEKTLNDTYLYAFKEFLICRVTFYKAAEVLMKLKFIDRVMSNCIRMISILEKKKGMSMVQISNE
jgi:hydroxymethylglutaryl-CoA reductase (NADPH)